MVSQIVFHGIWGTFSEDFGILSWMTGKNDWAIRNQLDNAFSKMGVARPKKFKQIPIRKYAQLTSANQTGLLSITSLSVFSGYTTHLFTDKFYEYMETTHVTSSSVRKNMETLLNIMQNTKSSLYLQLKENKAQKRGTNACHCIESSTPTEYGEEIKETPTTIGRFFLQSQDQKHLSIYKSGIFYYIIILFINTIVSKLLL